MRSHQRHKESIGGSSLLGPLHVGLEVEDRAESGILTELFKDKGWGTVPQTFSLLKLNWLKPDDTLPHLTVTLLGRKESKACRSLGRCKGN